MPLHSTDAQRLLAEYNNLLQQDLDDQEQMALFAALLSLEELNDLARDPDHELAGGEIEQLRRILDEFETPIIRNILGKNPRILQQAAVLRRNLPPVVPAAVVPDLAEHKAAAPTPALIDDLVHAPVINQPTFHQRNKRSIRWGALIGLIVGIVLGVAVTAALAFFCPPALAGIGAIIYTTKTVAIGAALTGALGLTGAATGAAIGAVASERNYQRSIALAVTNEDRAPHQHIYTLLDETKATLSPIEQLKDVLRKKCDVPDHFQCPFMIDYPADPVLLHGHLYERAEITKYLDRHGDGVDCPFRIGKISHADLDTEHNVNNQQLKNLIAEFKEQNAAILERINNLTTENTADIEREVADYRERVDNLTQDFLKKPADPANKERYRAGFFRAAIMQPTIVVITPAKPPGEQLILAAPQLI